MYTLAVDRKEASEDEAWLSPSLADAFMLLTGASDGGFPRPCLEAFARLTSSTLLSVENDDGGTRVKWLGGNSSVPGCIMHENDTIGCRLLFINGP